METPPLLGWGVGFLGLPGIGFPGRRVFSESYLLPKAGLRCFLFQKGTEPKRILILLWISFFLIGLTHMNGPQAILHQSGRVSMHSSGLAEEEAGSSGGFHRSIAPGGLPKGQPKAMDQGPDCSARLFGQENEKLQMRRPLNTARTERTQEPKP